MHEANTGVSCISPHFTGVRTSYNSCLSVAQNDRTFELKWHDLDTMTSDI